MESMNPPRYRPERLSRRTLLARLALTLLSVAVVSLPAKSLREEPPPVFREVSVHDPSVIRSGDMFYIFGSHLAAARSKDLRSWEQIADGVNDRNPLFYHVEEELKETLAWAQSRTLWAPDVVRLKDGRFAMYYCACKGDSPRSALGLATSDQIEGPYRDQGILLKSGMWGQPSEDGTVYEARVHPNTVDPNAFYDTDGQLWMVYGSYSGGIYIIKMDARTGKPLPGQGYGKCLVGGNHSRIEGPYVLYHPKTKYYYLYLSYGGLDSHGGYNIRVARARRPDGPYYDAEGKAIINAKADSSRPLFDDRSIEPYGTKLMGSFQFATGRDGYGYVSPGHNSAYYDPKTGKQFLIFHTRFPGTGEFHQVRVHQMFLNRAGWPVVAPYRYSGETAGKIKRENIIGDYQFVSHGRTITADIVRSQTIHLAKDGTISGALQGTWKKSGDNQIAMEINGSSYSGILLRQWQPETSSRVLTFSVLSTQGTALWGIQAGEK